MAGGLSPPLPLAEAQRRLLAAATPLPAEIVAANDAVGRYLAEPLIAARTSPAADLSAMDGFAVRADDCPGPWRVIGESAAGHPYANALSPGEAVRISTGALMPPGDGAVLLQENAARTGDALSLNGEGDPTPRHIRRAGFGFRTGDRLLAPGARVGPVQLALALTAGQPRVTVHRLPRLAIIDSGDELTADPAACAMHQVPASNGAMLAALAAPCSSGIVRLGPIADDIDALLAALDAAESADVVVTSGGASVGDHDLIRPALERWGASLEFWRVAIKPGKPLLVARRSGQWIVGLPGNPVSSYVTAFLFLLPLLRRLAGSAEPLPRAISVPLGGRMPPTGDRNEFIRAFFSQGAVMPLGERDSSALASLARAEALIERPAGSPAADRLEQVRVYPLHNGGSA